MLNEVMRVLNKCRILSVLMISVCLILGIQQSAFAADDDLILTSEETEYPEYLPEPPYSDEYICAVVYELDDVTYCIVHLDTGLLISRNYYTTQSWAPTFHFKNGYIRYELVDNEWVLDSDGSNSTKASMHFFSYKTSSVASFLTLINFVYSDVDIYARYDSSTTGFQYLDEENDDLVFQGAPKRIVISSGLTATSISSLMLAEIRGLIPLAIGFLVLVLAFWKGWKMLRQALQGA